MPSAAGHRMYEHHMPSFMSVYDLDAKVMDNSDGITCTKVTGTTYESNAPDELLLQQNNPPHTDENPNENPTLNQNEPDNLQMHNHQHCESMSTQTSDSTDSSPTTTISTVDSSSLSDPSPSSSPESPITLVPLSSFTGSSFGLDAFQSLKIEDSIPRPLLNGRPMTSPSPRKFKNLKSLALNLGPTVERSQISEPSSPSFIKPPALKPRKKPSLLSLNTGSVNTLSIPGAVDSLASPKLSSMLQRRSLKHSISSPQMLSTPSFGPSGGMTLGERKGFGPLRSGLGGNTFTINEDADPEPPAGVQMATRIPGVMVGGDSFDRPHSGEDAKSPSYPNGPVLIYEPSVHLYLEPKAEEAREFDVVINVAREVKNPFEAGEKVQDNAEGLVDNAKTTLTDDDIPPDTAASILSFQTAFEVQPPNSTESSPTTPKPSTETRNPEYIHIPWEHNTDVESELWDLCSTIDARVKEGKKVLIHCQQGASRSATLIIAYGMFINPSLTSAEAYAQAKEKSQWINPNMSLLFALNAFKKVIDRKMEEKSNGPVRKPTVKHRPTLSADMIEIPSSPSRARGNSTPSTVARDAAVTSVVEEKEVPQKDSVVSRFTGFDFGFGASLPSRQSGFNQVPFNNKINSSFGAPLPFRQLGFNEGAKNNGDPGFGAPLPFRQCGFNESSFNMSLAASNNNNQLPLRRFSHERHQESSWDALMSPRVTEMTQNPLQSLGFGASAEVPPTPALFSPRAFEFPRSSFFPTPLPPHLPHAVDEDPRSPPTKGEVPIIRSIDDFL